MNNSWNKNLVKDVRNILLPLSIGSAFLLCILVYGYALTNFTLTADSTNAESHSFWMALGRWGISAIRHVLAPIHLPYFTLLLALFFISLSAVLVARLLAFKSNLYWVFILLYISFPQFAYQLAFNLQADAIGIGYFTGSMAPYLFIRTSRELTHLQYFIRIFLIILLLVFTLAIYQALIFVPIAIFAMYQFLQLDKSPNSLKSFYRESFYFVFLIGFSALLYWVSVKLFCPPITDYLNSYNSGAETSRWSQFWEILKNNLLGEFYYGEQAFVYASLSAILILLYLLIKPVKYKLLKILILIFITILPYFISLFIEGKYHPPRLYTASALSFSFLITFFCQILQKTKITNSYKNVYVMVGLFLYFMNTFLITHLFSTNHSMYEEDLNIAKEINLEINRNIEDFDAIKDYVFFYGQPSKSFRMTQPLPNSEIFSNGILSWDGGKNQRYIRFFRYNNIANYRYLDNEKSYNLVIDSIPEMPIWPAKGSIKKIGDVVVVKLNKNEGKKLNFNLRDFGTKSHYPIKKLKNFPEKTDQILYDLKEVKYRNDSAFFNGWAAKDHVPSIHTESRLILYNEEFIYEIETDKILRKDVTQHFKNGVNYDESGFVSSLNLDSIPLKNYKIGIEIIQDSVQKFYIDTGKELYNKRKD